jgi:hypothetical protein
LQKREHLAKEQYRISISLKLKSFLRLLNIKIISGLNLHKIIEDRSHLQTIQRLDSQVLEILEEIVITLSQAVKL